MAGALGRVVGVIGAVSAEGFANGLGGESGRLDSTGAWAILSALGRGAIGAAVGAEDAGGGGGGNLR